MTRKWKAHNDLGLHNLVKLRAFDSVIDKWKFYYNFSF
ncbi:hypothetical protein SLEP1_g15867 [Rubroshorea leprosula]|uniref:Uncharacterized protein n=1 Tax=Rubroshorea leprosula TaxID=152421 RepID=A0AAV5INX1_9ROSI|nr:hypothetical protein SLEP1_g15867 [Rubroshorea leprosula]